MSGFIGAALPTNGLLVVDDRRCLDEALAGVDFATPMLVPLNVRDADTLYEPGSGAYISPWWPTPGGLLGSGALDAAAPANRGWGTYYPVSGANGRLAISGYTRDAAGGILPFCTVKLFRSANDVLQTTVTSDGNGYYVATTSYADAHYLVVYRVGPPDIAGTTVNTLMPG